MKFCVLGSGSSGNCIYFSSETTGLLIDAGLSGKETFRRLDSIGADTEVIQAVCVTHEHSDHVSGLSVLTKKLGLNIFANSATAEAVTRSKEKLASLPWKVFASGSAFMVGDISVEPFSVSHDAYDPVGFVLEHGGVKIAVATDIGIPTSLVRERFRGATVMVIESNHDEKLLQESPRPWSLKQRISGRQGHMSNKTAAEFVAELAGPDLQCVYLAHMSSDCNDAGLAVRATTQALAGVSCQHVRVLATSAYEPSEVYEG